MTEPPAILLRIATFCRANPLSEVHYAPATLRFSMARTQDLFQRGAYVSLVLRRVEFELITAEGWLAASFWGENVGFAVHVLNVCFWSAQRGGDEGRGVLEDIASVIGMPGRYRELGPRWFTDGI